MARIRTVPLARAAPNVTLRAWGGIIILGSLLLPWFRQGRDLLAVLPDTAGWALLPGSPLMASILAAALLAGAVGVIARPDAVRGRAAVAVGIAGALLTSVLFLLDGRPFGPGPLVAFLGFLAVLGTGLALSGMLRADAFIAGTILWVAFFVVVFILYPLWAVLQASVVVKGRFTLEVFGATLTSPGFLLVNNPATPRDEGSTALAAGAVIAVAATFIAWLTGRRRRALLWGILAGMGGGVITALHLGHGALRNSVLLALIVGGVSTFLAFLFALMGERSRLPTRRLLAPFSILPIITPPFVLAIAMIFLFGRRGLVTFQLLGISTNAIFSPLGVAIAQILAYTPIAYLVLQGVIQSMDAALEEAAETLGASRWQMLRTVIWPLARPGLANAFLLTVIESLADFGNPIVIGGGAPFMATEVFFAIVGRFNPHEAAVYGVVLLLMTLVIFLAQRLWLGRGSYVTVTGRPSGARARPMPRALDYGVSVILLFWMALVLVLYGSVFIGGVTKLWGFNWTLTREHLQILLPGQQGWQVFWTTVRLSALAMLPSMLLGFLIGYLVTRVDFPGRSALEFGSMLSFAIPGTVMGIAYILAFNQGGLLLTGTGVILILAFIFRNMPVGIRSSIAAIYQIDRSLEEASTMLRANSVTTLRRIVVPLTLAALLSGLIFSFVRAMTAVSQVIFLTSPGTNLATTQIFTYIEGGRLGRGAALASLLTLALVVVILLLYGINRILERWVGVRAAAPVDARVARGVAAG